MKSIKAFAALSLALATPASAANYGQTQIEQCGSPGTEHWLMGWNSYHMVLCWAQSWIAGR